MTSIAAGHVAEDQPKAKVFISYSRKDVAFADRMEAALKARGFEPLIDRSEIYAFEDWWKRIQDLIASADTFVFVISPDSVASDICGKEVAFAASVHKRFAPVVFARVDDRLVPEALARLNFIFFDDEAIFDTSLTRLIEALTTDIDWIRKHTAFGEESRRWMAAGRPGGLLLRSPLLEQAERWIATRPENAPAPTAGMQTFIAASRQGATRRRNIVTGSMAAGLLLALVLAGLAYWQRTIAVEQRAVAVTERDSATRNFKLAQGAAESLVIEVAQGLRNARGISADVVRKILETSRATFERLAASAPNDMNLRRSRAVMLREFGDTYVTLGDLAGALAAYQDSLVLAERLVAAEPDNPQWQRELALSHGKVGDALFAQDRFEDAQNAYRQGLAIAERLAARQGASADWQSDLALARMRIGVMAQVENRLDTAVTLFREAVAIMEPLVAANPTNTEWQSLLLGLYDKVGDVVMAQGKLDAALKAYRDSLAIAERLAAANPSNTLWQRGVSVFHSKIGNVLLKQGKADAALSAYRDALAIDERLSATDPGNTEWRRDVAISYGNIADVLAEQGKLDEALENCRKALDTAEHLAAIDHSNAQWQHILQSNIERIGDMSARFLLVGAFNRALEIADQAIALAPEKIWLYSNRAHALMFLDRVDEARVLYLKYRGAKNVQDDKSWEAVILDDFAELRKAGLTNPLMDQIEKAFAAGG
jgi:tetratricopeptide (TPR) repeat protein